MKKLLFLFLILFTFNGIAQDMYFDSMIPPSLTFNQNSLEIILSYNIKRKNQVKCVVNTTEKEIVLSASTMRRYNVPSKRIVNLKRYKINDPKEFKVYWMDPDNRKHLLLVHSESKKYYASTPFPFRENDKWYYVDSNFNKLSENFDFVYPFNGNFGIVKQNEKYALIDKSLSLITNPVFDNIYIQGLGTNENPSISVIKNGKSIKIDTLGQAVKNFNTWQWTDRVSQGSAYKTYYKTNGKMGLLRNLDTITLALYDNILPTSDEWSSHFLVCIDKKFGIIDNKGNETLPIIYDEIRMHRYNERWYDPKKELFVCIDNKCGFIDNLFRLFTELKYTDALPFSLDFSLVQTPDGKWGYIDRQGREYWK